MDQDTTNALAALNTSLDGATQRVQTDVKNFQDRIAALQATIDAGNADPALITALNDAKARLDAIDPTSSTTLTTAAAQAQKANFNAQQQAAQQPDPNAGQQQPDPNAQQPNTAGQQPGADQQSQTPQPNT